jgi:alkylation response protein AidB-like acyl-CoA dehydrogenase
LRHAHGKRYAASGASGHLLADLLLEVEAARAAADYAAWAAAASPTELPRAAGLAKAVCSDTYVQAAGVNLQVHGGMGFTWEHDAHLHLKRAMAGKQLYGSPDEHRERLAAAALSEGPS